jgi:hypothetical protein
MTVATFLSPSRPSQSGAAYQASIEDSIAVLARLAAAFAPHAQDTPDMTVRVDAGASFTDAALTEVAAQNTDTFTAPVTHPRIDRVVREQVTGAVAVVAGTEDADPVPPAIPAGHLPIARVLLQTDSTAITNSMITDERQMQMGQVSSFVRDSFLGAANEAAARAALGIDIPAIGTSRVLDRDVTLVEVVNTTTETTVYTFELPANTLGTDRMLRLTLLGDTLHNSGLGPVKTVRVKLGATTVATCMATHTGDSSGTHRAPFRLVAEISGAGALDAQVALAKLWDPLLGSPAAAGWMSGASSAALTGSLGTLFQSGHNAVAEDSTEALTLAVTVQWPIPSASISARVHVVQLELL